MVLVTCAKKWYLTRACKYVDISSLFSALGILLIDGDALVHYLIGNTEPDIQSLNPKLETMLRSFSERGFNNIKVIFFHEHSKFTQSGEALKSCLAGVFKPEQLLIFDR